MGFEHTYNPVAGLLHWQKRVSTGRRQRAPTPVVLGKTNKLLHWRYGPSARANQDCKGTSDAWTYGTDWRTGWFILVLYSGWPDLERRMSLSWCIPSSANSFVGTSTDATHFLLLKHSSTSIFANVEVCHGGECCVEDQSHGQGGKEEKDGTVPWNSCAK